MPLDNAILAVLTGGPLHGHALGKELDRLLHGLWAVNPGQVYATLGRLASEGAIAQVRQDDGVAPPAPTTGRAYALRPAGRSALRRWLDRPLGCDEHAEPFAQQLAVLLASGDHERATRTLEGQRRRCAALRTLLDRRSHARRHVDDVVAEAARRHLDAELAWLTAVERALLARERAAEPVDASAEPGVDVSRAHDPVRSD